MPAGAGSESEHGGDALGLRHEAEGVTAVRVAHDVQRDIRPAHRRDGRGKVLAAPVEVVHAEAVERAWRRASEAAKVERQRCVPCGGRERREAPIEALRHADRARDDHVRAGMGGGGMVLRGDTKTVGGFERHLLAVARLRVGGEQIAMQNQAPMRGEPRRRGRRRRTRRTRSIEIEHRHCGVLLHGASPEIEGSAESRRRMWRGNFGATTDLLRLFQAGVPLRDFPGSAPQTEAAKACRTAPPELFRLFHSQPRTVERPANGLILANAGAEPILAFATPARYDLRFVVSQAKRLPGTGGKVAKKCGRT